MTMYSNRLKSMKIPVASWLRVLSDRCHVMFNSFPRLGDAVGADDLPVPFILKRDARREKAGNGKRHYPMSGPVVKGIDRASGVHVAEHRAHARSTLRANADRRNKHRAA
jgi:hypothetical protein